MIAKQKIPFTLREGEEHIQLISCSKQLDVWRMGRKPKPQYQTVW